MQNKRKHKNKVNRKSSEAKFRLLAYKSSMDVQRVKSVFPSGGQWSEEWMCVKNRFSLEGILLPFPLWRGVKGQRVNKKLLRLQVVLKHCEQIKKTSCLWRDGPSLVLRCVSPELKGEDEMKWRPWWSWAREGGLLGPMHLLHRLCSSPAWRVGLCLFFLLHVSVLLVEQREQKTSRGGFISLRLFTFTWVHIVQNKQKLTNSWKQQDL